MPSKSGESISDIAVTPEIDILFMVIADNLGVSREEICRSKGVRKIIHAKRVFCVITRRSLMMTLQAVGDVIGVDHATVLYHTRKHDEEINVYDDYDSSYKKVYESVEAIYLTKTEFSPDYLTLKLNEMQEQLQIISRSIDVYKERITLLR